MRVQLLRKLDRLPTVSGVSTGKPMMKVPCTLIPSLWQFFINSRAISSLRPFLMR